MDPSRLNFLAHDGTLNNPVGYTVAANGGSGRGFRNQPGQHPHLRNSDTLWLRVQNDGTTVTVKAVNAATAPSESTWTSTTACYSSTAFSNVGGLIGINCSQGSGYVNNFTLKSWDTATSAFDITEHYDNFTVDGSGYASETPTCDLAGNLTYDGVQQYTYDAWNRLIGIAHAYRDSSGTLQRGQTFDAMRYDPKGRRLSKAVSNTGQWDCTYNYYYDQDRMIEERNGSNQTMKQHVWGLTYIDELVQVAANSNPTTGNSCSNLFWASQDANFNVLGLVNSSGSLVERYEYTPYGQRKVLFAAGNTSSGNTSSYDPGCYAIAYASPRFTSNMPCFGLNDIGHQSLMHDEECGLIYNRARYLHAVQGSFLTKDPAEYRDGMNTRVLERGNPIKSADPSGMVLYAFDGTWNWPGQRESDKTRAYSTNVQDFTQLYEGTKVYERGIGNSYDNGVVGQLFNGLTGTGGDNYLDDAYRRLVYTYNDGITTNNRSETDIDVIGYSRGAALARIFVNMISNPGIPALKYGYIPRQSGHQQGNLMPADAATFHSDARYCRYYHPHVRFLGLWDTVASFGIPLNFSGSPIPTINWGLALDRPANVDHVFHVIRDADGRIGFQSVPIGADPGGELNFGGSHWDAGTSPDTLRWMIIQAQSVGVPVNPPDAINGVGA